MKRHVTLTPDQKKIYEQMKKAAMAVLNGKITTTMTVLTQLMRLHQITCGHFTADDKTIKPIKNERVTALVEILKEVENKAVIWAHWRQDIKSIIETVEKEYGKDSYVTYYGDTPPDERQKF